MGKRNFRVLRGRNFKVVADGKGFEPSKACTLHAFQACSFNRSDTHLIKSRDYSENLKFCQIPFRRASVSPLNLKRGAWNFAAAFGILSRCLEFFAAIRISPYCLEILPRRLEFCRATKPGRLTLPSRAAILPCCGYFKIWITF